MTTCAECGKDTTLDRRHHHYVRHDKELCFSCNFWMMLVLCDRTLSYVIDGHHYILGPQGSGVPSQYRGFSGRKFIIQRLSDGRTIETVDLWHQGKIPQHFRDRLPDDAVFVRSEEDNVIN